MIGSAALRSVAISQIKPSAKQLKPASDIAGPVASERASTFVIAIMRPPKVSASAATPMTSSGPLRFAGHRRNEPVSRSRSRRAPGAR